jgi:hypothetical protein
MQKRKFFMGFLCGLALLSLVSCGHDINFVTSTIANALQLGTMRLYKSGDQWKYALTGTYVDSTGTVPVTPGTATLNFSDTPTAIGPVTDAWTLTLTVPVSYPGYSATEVMSFAFKQLANGTMNIYGIAPNGSPMEAVTSAPLYIPGPDASALNTVCTWNQTATIAFLGLFTINTTNQGSENVTVGGKTYQCYKITGNKVVGGFPSTFTAWINPQTGAFVKMETSYAGLSSSTVNLTYEMQSNTIGL